MNFGSLMARIFRGAYMSHLRTMLFVLMRPVISVGEQGMIGHNVIFKQSLEIFLSPAAKQEPIDLRAKLLEGTIRRSKQSSAFMVGCVIDAFEKSGLCES